MARAVIKTSSEKGQNIFMHKNINFITIIIMEGIEKIKTEKKLQQKSLNYISFTNAIRKRQCELSEDKVSIVRRSKKMARRFDSLAMGAS